MDKAEVYRILNEAYFSEDAHEKATLRAIAGILRNTSLFVDAGASLGQYTRVASEFMHGGTIIAVEADPIRFEELERNCRTWAANSRVKIRPVHAALTDVSGPVTFFTTETNISGGLFEHTIDSEMDFAWKPLTVEGVTLDELCCGMAPDLVKMDIEGGELRALRGGGQLLASGSPRLLVEVHSWPDPEGQRNAQEVFDFMRSLGFHTYPVGGSHMFDRRPGAVLHAAGAKVKRVNRKLRRLVRG
jgi:FkbM family methyltransferase